MKSNDNSNAYAKNVIACMLSFSGFPMRVGLFELQMGSSFSSCDKGAFYTSVVDGRLGFEVWMHASSFLNFSTLSTLAIGECLVKVNVFLEECSVNKLWSVRAWICRTAAPYCIH